VKWIVVASLAAAGCRQLFGIGGDPTVGTPGDAVEAKPDGPDADLANCFGSHIQICPAQKPTQPLMLMSGGITFDTGGALGLCADFTSPQNATGCLIAGTDVTLGSGTFRVVGPRPLIVLATGTATLGSGAMLDLASHVNGQAGAGAGSPDCNFGGSPSTGGGISGGGAGGSFGGKGGDGGDGAQGVSHGTAGTPTVVPPATLRGGCSGQAGAGAGGNAGGGGGGVVLVIAHTIEIDGTVDASGAGGAGGASGSGGGGGGGSGGLVVLDFTSLALGGTPRVFANGGGGGGGSSTGNPGMPGADPTSPTSPASGGAGGNANAGGGGDGSYSATPTGGTGGHGMSTASGGGGGGGAGYIILYGPTMIPPGVFAPAPITH
jgi:hypothetical protein